MVVVGIVGLGQGASWLVDGASRLALRLGVSPMVVGLMVVGFGTSMPEFAVSVRAALVGSGGLSLGNAVGSNIMNLLLVLGVAAVLKPIHVVGGERVLRRDLVFGVVPAFIIMAMAWNGFISRPTAVALLMIFAAFIAIALRQAQTENTGKTVVKGSPLRHLGLAAVGIVVLVIGSEMMVRGGIELATRFGVSDAVIGLTLVAFGTSLPELATSVAAALKGESEISIGNVLGSNIFNLGLVVGTAFSITACVGSGLCHPPGHPDPRPRHLHRRQGRGPRRPDQPSRGRDDARARDGVHRVRRGPGRVSPSNDESWF